MRRKRRHEKALDFEKMSYAEYVEWWQKKHLGGPVVPQQPQAGAAPGAPPLAAPPVHQAADASPRPARPEPAIVLPADRRPAAPRSSAAAEAKGNGADSGSQKVVAAAADTPAERRHLQPREADAPAAAPLEPESRQKPVVPPPSRYDLRSPSVEFEGAEDDENADDAVSYGEGAADDAPAGGSTDSCNSDDS